MGGIERFGLPKQGGVPASQAVKANGWLFVAGQVPKTPKGNLWSAASRNRPGRRWTTS